MAIDLNGLEGLSVRLGRFLGGINQVNTFRSTTTDARVSLILSGYPTANEHVSIDDIDTQESSYQQTANSWLQYFQSASQTTVIEQVNRDVPLTQKTLLVALQTWIAQMKANGQAYARPTTSISVAAYGSNYGDAELVASLTDTDGNPLDMVFPENITATVTSDAGTGATAYAEPVRAVGLPAVDGLSSDWPQGSGANQTFSITNGASTTLINNGGFDTWSSPTAPPSDWTIATGIAGTTVVRSTDNCRGTYSCQYAGNGSELTSIYQAPNTTLTPNTIYVLGFWAKRSNSLADGVLRFRLADGTGTTINNDLGTANSKSITLSSALTTSYTFQSVFFQTPKILPSTVRIYLDLTTAITNGETINIDLVSFVAATQLYTAGPFAAAFSGATQSARNDYWTITVTNDGGTTSFIPAMDRIFSLRSLGVKFPTTVGTPVSSNALIQ